MTTKNNGGPAFSGTYSARSDQGRGPVVEMHDKGMSLRDYFAASAVNGLMGRVWGNDKTSGEEIIKQWAASAYAVADAMLEERAK